MIVTSDMKFGKLRIKNPQNITYGSNKKIEWICDCGRKDSKIIKLVLSGQTKSCGKCNLISAAEISKKKFGKLRIKIPQDLTLGSNKIVEWICDCGLSTFTSICNVTNHHTKSCGRCNLICAADIATRKFGHLKISNSQDIMPGSEKKTEWTCDCGQEKLIKICEVLSGNTKSCGECFKVSKNWYVQNKEQIRSLKCPIKPENFVSNGIIPLETIKNTTTKFKAICPACKNIYYPRLADIKTNKSLTCGCCTYRISIPVIQISEYIKSLGFEIINEFKVNKLFYDICVPYRNLLIEFQGTRWHSFKGSIERDKKKARNASHIWYQFMEILESDWKYKRSEIMIHLKNKLIPMV
jgi:hypothetical protein